MNKKKQTSEDLFDIEELRRRGYEEESTLCLCLSLCSMNHQITK